MCNLHRGIHFQIIILLYILQTEAIVNLHQETANMVIYLRRPAEVGARPWIAGADCLYAFSRIFLRSRVNLTRSSNMVIGHIFNMSSPAAQIQDNFIRRMQEGVTLFASTQKRYQIRIITDAIPYEYDQMAKRALIFADCYVIVMDELDRFRNLMRNYISHMISWNPRAPFLILFNNRKMRLHAVQVVKSIFEELVRNFYAHRIGVLYAVDEMQYEFTVLNYYKPKNCGTITLLNCTRCYDGKPVSEVQILTNCRNAFVPSNYLNSCNFKMCATIYAPFVEEGCNDGIEIELIHFINRRLNFSITKTCSTLSRGVPEPSGNWTGLLGMVDDGLCDFIVGGFYPDNQVGESFATTDCYLQDEHTWFVKLADPRPIYIALYSIFDFYLWIGCLITLVISSFAWYFFVNALPEPRTHKTFSLTAINAIGVTICYAINERPICISSRIFFLTLSLYGMNLIALYTSDLISVFTDPGHLHQIHSLHEIIKAHMPFGGVEESRDWFETEIWIFDRYNDSDLFKPNPENLIAVKRGDRAILNSRMNTMRYNISDDIYACHDRVFSSPLQMIMRRGFPFVQDFNSLISRMRDFGFFEKNHRDFLYNNTYLNRISKMRPVFQKPVIVITTKHMEGPFAIYLIGIGSSLLAFIVELVCDACAKYFHCFERGDGRKNTRIRHVKNSKKHQLKRIMVKLRLRKMQQSKREIESYRRYKRALEIPVYNVNTIDFTPIKKRSNTKK